MNNSYEMDTPIVADTKAQESDETQEVPAQETIPEGQFPTEPENTVMPSKKKKYVLIGVGVLTLLIAILIPSLLRRTYFSRLRTEIITEYPSAVVRVASDGSYMEIDTNPYNKSTEDMTYAQLYLFQDQQEDSINAIEFTNRNLGFSDSVYHEMLTTNALMGRQSSETTRYTVSWKYHPDTGLEVMYKQK